MMTFPGNVAALSKHRPSTHYVPLKFNLKAIDALHVEVNEQQKTAMVVAVAKRLPSQVIYILECMD